jgi:nucleotide-binding universal stress UspA family protein
MQALATCTLPESLTSGKPEHDWRKIVGEREMTTPRALVAVDFDDNIASIKSSINQWARGGDGHVTVVGVSPALSGSMTNPRIVSLAKGAEQTMLDNLRARIDQIGEDINTPIDFHMLSGATAEEIIKAAVLYDADFVIKLADRPVGAKAPLFGAVEKKLIRKCPVPVWIVRPEQTLPPQTIAIAVDNTDTASNKAEAELVAAGLLRHGVDLARRFNCPTVKIIHAWKPEALGFLEHPRSGLSAENIKQYIREWEEITYKWIESFVNAANERYSSFGVAFKPKLVMGDALDAIPTAVKNDSVDILVIGSANRSGVSGLFIGNTAEGVLSRVECSVFVVKPADFRTVLASCA